VLVTVAVVALSLTPNGVYAFGLAMGAALLVTMFAALGDIRLAPRLALTGALGGFAVGLPLIPICTTDTSFFDADVGQFLLFWFAVFSVVIGLLLPIRVYQGAIARPTLRESARRPSLGGLFAIIGYFALVALPLSAALEGNGGVGAMFMALILWGACAAPVLALLSESLRWRILGATQPRGCCARSRLDRCHERFGVVFRNSEPRHAADTLGRGRGPVAQRLSATAVEAGPCGRSHWLLR
jgi:hypothetical protein